MPNNESSRAFPGDTPREAVYSGDQTDADALPGCYAAAGDAYAAADDEAQTAQIADGLGIALPASDLEPDGGQKLPVTRPKTL